MNQWLSDSIDRLNVQMDKFESDVEANTLALKKKKSDKEKMEKIDELKDRLEKHRYHVYQLETLMRMLDNATIAVDDVRSIRDDLEFYMDATESCDPDFTENEYMYADIDGMDTFDEFVLKKQGNCLTGDCKEEDGLNSLHSVSPVESAVRVAVASPPEPFHKRRGHGAAGDAGREAGRSQVPAARQPHQFAQLLLYFDDTSLNHHPHRPPPHQSDSQEDSVFDAARSPAQSPPGCHLSDAKHSSPPVAAVSSLPLTYSKVIEKPAAAAETTAWTNGPSTRAVTPGQKNSLPASSMSLKYLSQKALTKQDASATSQVSSDGSEPANVINDHQTQQTTASSMFDQHHGVNGPSLQPQPPPPPPSQQQHKAAAPVGPVREPGQLHDEDAEQRDHVRLFHPTSLPAGQRVQSGARTLIRSPRPAHTGRCATGPLSAAEPVGVPVASAGSGGEAQNLSR